MMLNGKKLKIFCSLILIVSVLFLACCNRKNINDQRNTTKEEIKQPITTIKEKHTEKTVDKITEKEITSIKEKVEISTTVINNGGDNQIVLDFFEDESLNINSTTIVTEEFAQNQTTTKENATQQIQAVTEPATDSEGWVTKWY